MHVRQELPFYTLQYPILTVDPLTLFVPIPNFGPFSMSWYLWVERPCFSFSHIVACWHLGDEHDISTFPICIYWNLEIGNWKLLRTKVGYS